MLNFRNASPEDIGLINLLAREIWMTSYPGILAMDQIEYMLGQMYAPEAIAREIQEGTVWELVEYNNESVGFLSVAIEAEKGIKLNKLYLKNAHHGKGFGQQALAHVINFAKSNGYAKITLNVNKENLNAIRAYEKAGFVRTDAVVNDIGHGYVMDDYVYCYFLE